MKLKGKSEKQLIALGNALFDMGNLNASNEVFDYLKYQGQQVKVVGGRKIPLGTVGEVFYVARKNYSGYADKFGVNSITCIGFKDNCGNVYYTNKRNIEII